MKKVIISFIVMVILSVSAYAAEEKQLIVVDSPNAFLYETPKLNSKKLAQIEGEVEFEVIDVLGIWFKIEYKKQIGWVSKYVLKPEGGSEVSKEDAYGDINLNKNARKRASSYSTAASARGFLKKDKDDKPENLGDLEESVKEIKQIEDKRATEIEVESFMHEGKLLQ